MSEQVLDTVNRIPEWIPRENRNVKYLRQFFSCNNLKKLVLEGPKFLQQEGLVSTIVFKCPELEELRLYGVYLQESEFIALSNLKHLKILCLHACKHLTDSGLMRLLRGNRTITHLELTGSVKMSGKFLKVVEAPLETLNLTNHQELDENALIENLGKFGFSLKHLNLSDNKKHFNLESVSDMLSCVLNLESFTLAHYQYDDMNENLDLSFITMLKNLKNLSLHHNEYTTDRLMRRIILECKQLQSLDLSNSRVDEHPVDFNHVYPIWENLASLPNLETLNLMELNEIKSSDIHSFACKSPPIKTLILIGCRQLQDDDIQCLLANCRQLEYLDIGGCLRITEGIVISACKMLEFRTDDRPLLIVAPGTKILDWIYNEGKDERVLPTHPLLTVSFENNLTKFENDYYSGPYLYSDYLLDDDEVETDDEHDTVDVSSSSGLESCCISD